MPLPARVVPVRPLGGMVLTDQGENLPLAASPDMQNFQVFRGILRKRPGYQQYPAAAASIGGRVCGVYSTHDVDDITYLYAAYAGGICVYNSGTESWDALTGAGLNGTDTRLVSFTTSQEGVVFSQGVDDVQLVTLGGTSYAALNANCPSCRYLTRYAERLQLGYTIESSVNKPYRTRWSVASDHTNWTGSGAGYRDHNEEPYFVRGLRKLQNNLALYTERSIYLGTRTGVASAPVRFDLAVADTGLLSPFSLAGLREFHFLHGTDNFYVFNGGAVSAIGDAIRDVVFAQLNPARLDNNWGIVIAESQEYLCNFVLGSDDYPSKAWVYNYAKGVWYPWSMSGHTCGTMHRLDSTVTIDGLVGTIDEQTWSFDDSFLTAAYPALITGHTNGKLYRWSNAFTSDDGAAIDAYWTSKDLTADDVVEGFSRHMVRLRKVGISYLDPGAAFTLSFYWSVDGGDTWQGPDTVTMGGSGTAVPGDATWFREITDRRIRIKIRNNSDVEQPQLVSLFFDLAIDSQVF